MNIITSPGYNIHKNPGDYMYCRDTQNDSVRASSCLKMTLPFICKPFQHESLYGYTLRLDIINGNPLGTTLSLINNHKTGRLLLNRPGLYITGKIFNINELSKITNISAEELSNLTFTPSLHRIYQSQVIYPDLVAYSNNFKICPLCIAKNTHPLLFILQDISYCMEHRVQLHDKCVCGKKILFFATESMVNCCPYCGFSYRDLKLISLDVSSQEFLQLNFYYNAYKNIIYDHISFVHEGEELSSGFENRLHYLINKNNITHNYFKQIFGYDINNAKNGHGISNLSISAIIHTLYKLGISASEFRDLQFDSNYTKITNMYPSINKKNENHTCPNIYCPDFNHISHGNIKYYGKRTLNSGLVKIEEFCSTCGTRFIGNNIIQSYDYNPGLRQYDIERARNRINNWQVSLRKICEEMIQGRIPITLTGCFKNAGIPIGKTYFIDRLGLIAILEESAQKQILESSKWIHELNEKDAASFLRRIYKRKKKNA